MYDAKEGKLTATRLGDPRFYLTKVLELSIVTVQGHELGELGEMERLCTIPGSTRRHLKALLPPIGRWPNPAASVPGHGE